MKEYDYVIIGGGCAGLSLAYELNTHNKLQNRTLAIIEPRKNYSRDKTWSFWRVFEHNFEDCIKKSWKNFSINFENGTRYLDCKKFPYQTIDSGLFYKKIINNLKTNRNISFFKNLNDIEISKSFIFNSIPSLNINEKSLWQHFCGYEIETTENIFDDNIVNLMDFDCEQKNNIHFFYTLPFDKNRALIETTWLSNMNNPKIMNYNDQIRKYIEKKLRIKNYEILYKEQGAIPLFKPINIKKNNQINIGTAGGMTRLSTGYTFLNIQEHSRYIRENIENISKLSIFEIDKKYHFLDKIFLKVIKSYPDKLPNIFSDMFKANSINIIKFLSNKSNIFEDLSIIIKMPKNIFIRSLF